MLNAERFKKEIVDRNYSFGLSNRIVKCEYEECATCLFSRVNNVNDGLKSDCTARKVKWLLSEYKEHVKLTKLEYELLKWLIGKDYKYIARDSGSGVYAYYKQPPKNDRIWGNVYGNHFSICDFRDLFQSVKWEDEEPTSIKEVLDNCAVVNDAKEL